MMSTSLKSTTAILMAMSLMQPLPALAQSSQEADENAVGAEAEAEPEALEAESAEPQAVSDKAADAQGATEADANAEAAAVEEAEAQAAADKEAEAQADAEAVVEEEAKAQTAATEEAEAQAAVEADASAPAGAEADADPVAAEENQPEAVVSGTRADTPDACVGNGVTSDGATACVETMTGGSLEALAADTEADTSAEVTTATVTEETTRSSNEEFEEWSPDDQQGIAAGQNAAPKAKSSGGKSDLEKAGLLALGAAVVGAVLLNGQRVEANTGDRVVVVDENEGYRILKDDDALLRQPGSDVRTQRFSDGSTRSNVMRGDGSEIVTIRDPGGRVLRRVLVETDGREYVLFDDTRSFAPVVTRDLPAPAVDDYDYQAASDRESLRMALLAADRRDIGRSFSLQQVREINEVRQLSPEINLQSITFVTASSAIQGSQAEQLRQMGTLMRDIIADDPTELFLIEGYTDAVGAPGANLLLSDRRAESVALALNEYFGVPTENMVVQGYGERFLKISTQDAERLNRRVAVRRITTLVR